ncbi:MAG TPA: VOC family protein [Gaiellaceae bacterium]
MTGRLSFVGLDVRDLDASMRFYGEVLGLAVRDGAGEQPFGWLGGRYGVIVGGKITVAVFPTIEAETTRRATLGFAVPDLDDVHERALAANVSVFDSLRDTRWGRRAMYHDPDGHVVVLIEAA